MSQHAVQFVYPTPSKEMFFIDSEGFKAFAEAHKQSYADADPFPHIVIRDFLEPEVLERVLDEFPAMHTMSVKRQGKTTHNKGHTSDERRFAPTTRQLVAGFNSMAFLDGLQVLTGIREPLIPDPALGGGGLHQTGDGGYLKVHADFNFDKRTGLDRRLNMLLYLNKDWDESLGGALELWRPDMSECVATVQPEFNTCVIFSTTPTSFHGHPTPMVCGQRMRKSIAIYWYSLGRPADEQRGAHTTVYRSRPGEVFTSPMSEKQDKKRLGRRVKDKVRGLIDKIPWTLQELEPEPRHNAELRAWFQRAITRQSRCSQQGWSPHGVYYEFGTGRGWSLTAYILAAKDACAERGLDLHSFRIVLFDTFAGLPPKQSAADDHPAWTPGRYRGELPQIRALVEELGFPVANVEFVEGLYEDTLQPELREGLLQRGLAPAIVTLDCDYYSSTAAALGFLRPALASGTLFYMDDIMSFHKHPEMGQVRAIKEFNAVQDGHLARIANLGLPENTYLYTRREWEYGTADADG